MPGHYIDAGWRAADVSRPTPQTDVLVVVQSFIDDTRTIWCAWMDVHGNWRKGETGGLITGGMVTHWMRVPDMPGYGYGLPVEYPMQEAA